MEPVSSLPFYFGLPLSCKNWLGAGDKTSASSPECLSTVRPSRLTLSQVLDPEVQHTHVGAVQNEHGSAKYGHANQVIQLICAELALCFAATSG